MSIVAAVAIENAIGGSGADVIVGNTANNVLKVVRAMTCSLAATRRMRCGAELARTYLYYLPSAILALGASDWLRDFQKCIDKIGLSHFNVGAPSSDQIHYVDHFSGAAGEALLT